MRPPPPSSTLFPYTTLFRSLQKIEDMGQTNNTIVVFTTDNGAEAISFPDGGVTPFKGQKGEDRSEEHTSELQSRVDLVCRLLLEKKKKRHNSSITVRSRPDA